jgi:hypothetical protein
MSNTDENINIVYSSIIREKTKILSEYTECSGNFSQIIKYIMTEVILKFENPPNKYKTYFFYGKYAIFLIKYEKIYLIIMFPNIKIKNNEIVFSLLYSFFDKLKTSKDIIFENISKMKPYSLSNFSNVFKEQIDLFHSNNDKFIPYLKYGNEFEIFEPFENRFFESQIELPILSNYQVHKGNNNNNDKDENYNEVIYRDTLNSIYTQDSFKDDILRQSKAENLIENGKNDEKILDVKDGRKSEINKDKENKCKSLKWVISISIIFLALVCILLVFYFNK